MNSHDGRRKMAVCWMIVFYGLLLKYSNASIYPSDPSWLRVSSQTSSSFRSETLSTPISSPIVSSISSSLSSTPSSSSPSSTSSPTLLSISNINGPSLSSSSSPIELPSTSSPSVSSSSPSSPSTSSPSVPSSSPTSPSTSSLSPSSPSPSSSSTSSLPITPSTPETVSSPPTILKTTAAPVLTTTKRKISPTESPPLPKKPHVILMVADDLGWNDVSWNNPGVITPHLGKLASRGIILNQSYVLPTCTPTRAALLTGRYPYTIGMQKGALDAMEPRGLSTKYRILPQPLKKLGYSTHIIGKWHLGFCSWDYTPLRRGFDTFYGFYSGAQDYYDHKKNDKPLTIRERIHSGKNKGYLDLRNNTQPDFSKDGVYSTYLFAEAAEEVINSRDPKTPMFLYLPFQSVHAPLQVPKKYSDKYWHVNDYYRRNFLGMVTAMDDAVGRVVKALKKTGHYENSVIIFTTDNGGSIKLGSSNYPLNGGKSNLLEGGIRGAAFVHSPLLSKRGTVSNQLIHVTDWYSTIVALAGGNAPPFLDSINQWHGLMGHAGPPRNKVVYNIDDSGGKIRAALRVDGLKLAIGRIGKKEWAPFHPVRQRSSGRESRLPDQNITGLEVDYTWNHSNELNSLDISNNDRSHNYTSTLENMAYNLDDSVINLLPSSPKRNDLVKIHRYRKSTTNSSRKTIEHGRSSRFSNKLNKMANRLFQKNGVHTVKPHQRRPHRNKNRIQDNKNTPNKVTNKRKVIKEKIKQKQKNKNTLANWISKIIKNQNKDTNIKHKHKNKNIKKKNKRKKKKKQKKKKKKNKKKKNKNKKKKKPHPYKDKYKPDRNKNKKTLLKWRRFKRHPDLQWDQRLYDKIDRFFMPNTKIRLYNITADPTESVDLAETDYQVTQKLLYHLALELDRYVPMKRKIKVKRGHPTNWNDVWSPGWCNAT